MRACCVGRAIILKKLRDEERAPSQEQHSSHKTIAERNLEKKKKKKNKQTNKQTNKQATWFYLFDDKPLNGCGGIIIVFNAFFFGHQSNRTSLPVKPAWFLGFFSVNGISSFA